MACLRLAERGGTPEESVLAAAKAQEIIDRYKLDVSGLDFDAQEKERDDEPVKDFGYEDPLDNISHKRYGIVIAVKLASVVARINQCRIVYRNHQDVYGGKVRTVSAAIKIIGRASDVSAVRYLYSYYKNEIERLAKLHTAGHSQTYYCHFCFGACDTLSERLNKSQAETAVSKREELAQNPMALVRLNSAIAKIEKRRQDVDAFVKAKLNLKGGGYNPQAVTGGCEAGRNAGHSIRLTGARSSLGNGRAQIH